MSGAMSFALVGCNPNVKPSSSGSLDTEEMASSISDDDLDDNYDSAVHVDAVAKFNQYNNFKIIVVGGMSVVLIGTIFIPYFLIKRDAILEHKSETSEDEMPKMYVKE